MPALSIATLGTVQYLGNGQDYIGRCGIRADNTSQFVPHNLSRETETRQYSDAALDKTILLQLKVPVFKLVFCPQETFYFPSGTLEGEDGHQVTIVAATKAPPSAFPQFVSVR